MDHPLPWLRYVDAGDLNDQTVEFDGLKVRNAQKETLGHVDGFIVGPPELVVEVNFDHITGNRIRHGARFVRWREDKAPEECTLAELRS